MVETVGISPSTMSAEPCATSSEAWLLAIPTPPTTGNNNPATMTPASTQNSASRRTVGRVGGYWSDMPLTLGENR